ncbi:MAG TPA: sugar phosphate isomerase/epimerase, partial [Candidatus Methylacidiphilales bacterium]
MLTPGLVSVTFRALSPEEIIALAGRAGLKGIEWGGDVHVPPAAPERAAEVGRRTRDAGLAVSSYGSYYRVGEDAPFEPVLEAARCLGAPTIRVWSGTVSSSAATEADRERVVADYVRIVRLAAREGIAVACEFHDGTLTDDGPTAAAMAERVPGLYTYWQPRHGKPVETGLGELDLLAPCLANLHVFHWWPTPAERLPLAEGRDRWAAFLKKAAAIPGNRFALLEFVAGDRPEQLLADAPVLRELLAEVG